MSRNFSMCGCGLAFLVTVAWTAWAGPQKLVLKTGELAATVLVDGAPEKNPPDFRFDRLGRVMSLKFRGKEYLGPKGMPDEIGIFGVGVLGYPEVRPDDAFVKMGVGMLLRDQGPFYRFMKEYPAKSLFKNQVSRPDADSVKVVQTMPAYLGYSYTYTKTYRLQPPSTLEIGYQLKNTGSRPFAFEQFNHNWFLLGLECPDTSVHMVGDWPVPLLYSWFEQKGADLKLLGEVDGAYTFVPEHGKMGVLRNLGIDSRKTGQSVQIRGDFTPSRFILFMEPTGICPEIFFYSHLEPAQKAVWTRFYQLQEP